MKRQAENNSGAPNSSQKRYRPEDDELRFLIPSRIAGSIIGRGGQNISKLRSQYKASITVPDCYGPERILTIRSDLDIVLQILGDIVPKLEESRPRSGSDNEIELRMLVHQSQAGCVIGKGGGKVKELREKTGAKIKIYSNCCPHSTDRVISMCGKADTVTDCIREILNTIKSSPIKGVNNPYDPINHDEFYAEEYGGFGEGQGGKPGGGNFGMGGRRGPGGPGGPGMPRGRSNRGGGPPPDMNRGGFPPSMMRNNGPRGGGGGMNMGGMSGGLNERAFGPNSRPGNFGGDRGGFNGSRGGPAPFSGGNFDDDWGRQGNNGPNGMGGNSGMGNPGFGGSNQGDQDDMGNVTSTQVTIPTELAGAIIGKGGARIRKIRADSGAGITIDLPLPGSNDRIITITGLADQIQMAQFLLQQSVHENANLDY